MQFYTKLRYAKIIIFFPRSVYLQCLFPGYFPDAIYFLDSRAVIILYNYYIGKCFCPLYELWSECFLWHITVEKKSCIAAVSPLAYNR